MNNRQNAEVFDGYLFSKLANIWSKSEGPIYFLQKFDYDELGVIKQVQPWRKDPSLHKFLNKKVTIEGFLTPRGIEYKTIGDYKDRKVASKEKSLEVVLKPESDILWVNKMPGPPQPPQCFELTLLVKWPYRSIWEGTCPTGQLYDFWIEYGKQVVWTWSEGRYFPQTVTKVNIPGGTEYYKFSEIWKFNPADIKKEGTYTARALFIASGQEVTQDFEIKFAR